MEPGTGRARRMATCIHVLPSYRLDEFSTRKTKFHVVLVLPFL
jgi:hypothetical protein